MVKTYEYRKQNTGAQETQLEPDHTAALLTPKRKLIQFRTDLKKTEKLTLLN